MKKGSIVQLTPEWWKSNKAKTLVNDKALVTALTNLKKASSNCDVLGKKGQPNATNIKEWDAALKLHIAALDKINKAAVEVSKVCVKKLHAETIDALLKGYPKAVAAEQSAVKQQRVELAKTAKLAAQVDKLLESTRQKVTKQFEVALEKGELHFTKHKKSIKGLYSDGEFRKEIYAFAKKNYWDESIEFLLTMNGSKGKDFQTNYDKFIKEGSPRQINIPGRTRKAIGSYMEAGGKNNGEDPSGAPWGAAVNEIESMVLRDSLPRFINEGIDKVEEKFGAEAMKKMIAAKEAEIMKKYLPGMPAG